MGLLAAPAETGARTLRVYAQQLALRECINGLLEVEGYRGAVTIVTVRTVRGDPRGVYLVDLSTPLQQPCSDGAQLWELEWRLGPSREANWPTAEELRDMVRVRFRAHISPATAKRDLQRLKSLRPSDF